MVVLCVARSIGPQRLKPIFSRSYGTTEVVPSQNLGRAKARPYISPAATALFL